MKKTVNERLLVVRGAICREYLPLSERLAQELRPSMDFVGRDFLPILVLLPTGKLTESAAVDLAAAMEFAYLAGRVHDLNADRGGALGGHAILLGDYLYAYAAVRLNNAGYDDWLEKVGRALVRRSEARQVSLSWEKRAYVTEEERLANLSKEHAELLSLAARLAAESAGYSAEDTAAYAEFGFYLGILHGLTVLGYGSTEAAQGLRDSSAVKARTALERLPELAEIAADMLLRPLLTSVSERSTAGATMKAGGGQSV